MECCQINNERGDTPFNAQNKDQTKHEAGHGTETTVVFSVPQMSCASCVRHIQDAIMDLPGYVNSRVDLDGGKVIVAYDPNRIEPEYFRTAIDARGYKVADDLDEPDAGISEDCCENPKKPGIVRPVVIGLIAASTVFGFYIGLMTLISDWYYAKYQFEKYMGWIIALAVGLGIQGALFTYFRGVIRGGSVKTAGKGLAASGGMSTAAMAACCSHYLVAILPALGLPFLTTAVAALERYQSLFFLLGVLSNLAGIYIMLRLFAKNGIISPSGHIGKITSVVFGHHKIQEESK